MYECFEVDIAEKVAHVRLSRPDAMNTMTPAFWTELPEIINEISNSASARVIVVSSTGKHFSAGMDLAVFMGGGSGIGASSDGVPVTDELGRQRADLRLTVLALQKSFSCLEEARMPVIAAIQGGCVGGAVDMVTACDLRYSTEDAWFCVQEINIGMTADVGTLQRLPKIIPEGVARQIAYTGERFPASRAHEVGLVNGLYPDHESLVEGVLSVASEIASKSPLAIWGSKQMLNYSRDHSVRDGLEHIAVWQSGMFQPADMVESFAAKAENRPPRFDDLLPASQGFRDQSSEGGK